MITIWLFTSSTRSERSVLDRINLAQNFKFQVLLGDMGTGKTSMVLRFVKGKFYDNQVSSMFKIALVGYVFAVRELKSQHLLCRNPRSGQPSSPKYCHYLKQL